MLGLVLAGAVIFVIGLLSVGFGFPVKEFSFGNTLILSGVVGACSGLILIALGMVVRELRAVGAALAGAPHHPELPEGVPADEGGHGGSRAGAPPPWFGAAPGRDRAGGEPVPPPPGSGAEPEPEPAAAEPAKRRRNLLFMSSKRGQAGDEDAAAGTEGEAPPVVETRVTFDEAWPAAERSRPESPRPPRAAVQDEPRTPPPIRRPAEAPPVTILKSGVVDGMAYTLYSDGSIEAQLPEGMIRFASIDDLRAHLEQRG